MNGVYSQLITEEAPAPLQEDCRTVQTIAQQMSSLVSDLLDISVSLASLPSAVRRFGGCPAIVAATALPAPVLPYRL